MTRCLWIGLLFASSRATYVCLAKFEDDEDDADGEARGSSRTVTTATTRFRSSFETAKSTRSTTTKSPHCRKLPYPPMPRLSLQMGLLFLHEIADSV